MQLGEKGMQDRRSVAFVEELEATMRRLHKAGYSFAPFTLHKKPNFAVLPKVWDQLKKQDKASWDPFKTRQPTEDEYLAWVTHPDTTGILGVFA